MTAPQAPAGFRNVAAEEPTGVRVDKEALTHGVVLQYRGTRRFPRQSGGTTTVHIFLARAGKGERFSTFGTAQLDSKLKAVKPGSIIWLLYMGKKEVDGKETHLWNVSNAGLIVSDEKIRELCANSAKEHDELDRQIALAASERSASNNGEPDIGQYDEENGRDFAPDNR